MKPAVTFRQAPWLGVGSTVLAAACLCAVVGCDLFRLRDNSPPTCRITSPTDSAQVSGTVPIQVYAFDSVGVVKVEFLVNAAVVATKTDSPYTVTWNTEGLAERSRHQLSCIAHDLAGNKGLGDTISVQIAAQGQRSVYHGSVEVQQGRYQSLPFDARSGDTLSGSVRVSSGGTLSTFAWLDSAQYVEFRAGRAYTALFSRTDFAEFSMSQAVLQTGQYYLVFVNSSTGTRACWVRFVLE